MSTGSAFTGFTTSPDLFPDYDEDDVNAPSLLERTSRLLLSRKTLPAPTAWGREDLRAYIMLAEDKCRYVFVARSQSRVCGNVGVDCHRPGRRAAAATRSPPGNYRGVEPARKGSPYDGDPGTWCLPVEERRSANYADYAALATPQSSGSRPPSREMSTSSPGLIGAGVSHPSATGVRGSVGASATDYARPDGRPRSPAGVQFGVLVLIRSSILKKAPPASEARQAEIQQDLLAKTQVDNLQAQEALVNRLFAAMHSQGPVQHPAPRVVQPPSAPPHRVVVLVGLRLPRLASCWPTTWRQ
jgi:hypothetical protein